MSDGNGNNGRIRSNQVWPAILSGAVALVVSGVIALITLGRQQGATESEFAELSRRITQVESNASYKGDVSELTRRIGTLEQYGSPVVQGLKTQSEIADRRIGALETQVGNKLEGLLQSQSAQDITIVRNTAELERLRKWRDDLTSELLAHYRQDAADDAKMERLNADVRSLIERMNNQERVNQKPAAP